MPQYTIFGPRWGIGAGSKGPGGERQLTEEEQKRVLDDLGSWIHRDNPSLTTIGYRLDVSDPAALR